ncbi:hypothetical protein [Candidatus Electronema sp. JM]|uniref:hypothetical protein n=1 Tax=Candidatus Electronema sp. JM TaxID=3401571 RepID=UPI003AA81C46
MKELDFLSELNNFLQQLLIFCRQCGGFSVHPQIRLQAASGRNRQKKHGEEKRGGNYPRQRPLFPSVETLPPLPHHASRRRFSAGKRIILLDYL